jgi:hypothetical protein
MHIQLNDDLLSSIDTGLVKNWKLFGNDVDEQVISLGLKRYVALHTSPRGIKSKIKYWSITVKLQDTKLPNGLTLGHRSAGSVAQCTTNRTWGSKFPEIRCNYVLCTDPKKSHREKVSVSPSILYYWGLRYYLPAISQDLQAFDFEDTQYNTRCSTSVVQLLQL